MKVNLNNILGGKFLVDKDAVKNWRMIIFLSLLALIMIGSSHRADEKVHRAAALREEVKELRSEFVDARLELRKLKMESTVRARLASRNIAPSATPPQKIIVKS